MYHPTRGGVRGGRDQFCWDEVKVDKHRENYLGHSIKAPVGRWQKGKDLHWYTRDKTSESSDKEATKEEIHRIKEEEEQAMREALGLAPKHATRPQGNLLDKYELSELVKRGSTAEDLGAGPAEAARVQGLGFSRTRAWDESSLPYSSQAKPVENVTVSAPSTSTRGDEDHSGDNSSRKKRRHEEKKREKHDKREKRHSRDSDEKKKRRKHKEKRRHGSD